MDLISACLVGVNCRYDGGNNQVEELVERLQQGLVIPVCPEQLGGLSTPRNPAELQGGDGSAAWTGGAWIISKKGEDFTGAFCRGAGETLALAQRSGCQRAILKENSPSCGSGCIRDGTFSGRLIPGSGVTAWLLRREGLQVFSEKNWSEKGEQSD